MFEKQSKTMSDKYSFLSRINVTLKTASDGIDRLTEGTDHVATSSMHSASTAAGNDLVVTLGASQVLPLAGNWHPLVP